MATPLDEDIEQQGELDVTSPAFDDGGQLPDWTGYANENENPPLVFEVVPDEAESLVQVLDDPDAQPVADHTRGTRRSPGPVLQTVDVTVEATLGTVDSGYFATDENHVLANTVVEFHGFHARRVDCGSGKGYVG